MLSAARGKTWNTRDRRWKFVSVKAVLSMSDRVMMALQDWSVPQFYFWHFYAVAVMMTLATWHMSEQLDAHSETEMLPTSSHLHESPDKVHFGGSEG